jgi:murein DD-endopeptidase MepM/ murein hydrolase activator NlpD
VSINGDLQTPEHFAIDFTQLGPNKSCCKGPPEALNSWWGYGTPVLAVADGVVAEVVDGLPDQQPVGTISKLPIEDFAGNRIIEDIGGGRYVGYFHLKPGSIPARVRKGSVLRPGDPIGRLGNSGNSGSPHLHFALLDRPSSWDATGLPFVFDTQLLEGRISEADGIKVISGIPVTIDRSGRGEKRNLMPARNDIFGYNLSR